MNKFNYIEAFSRNIGWVTAEEQQQLKSKKVAIAGMGGVGGFYIETLARLGVTSFHIADFDSFEIQNFNRQNGATMSTLHLKKAEVMKKKLFDINPEAQCKVFEEGVTEENMDEFLEGVDVYLDGLDFFVLHMRIRLFNRLEQLKIPAITVGPVGMGAAMVIFKPGSMSFNDYFGMSLDYSTEVNACHFIAGITPSQIQRHYLVDRTRFNFPEHRAPSTPMGCYLCTGVAGTNALKILLNRGDVLAAPWALQYDAYLNTYKKKYVWFGFRNPIQQLKIYLFKKSQNLLQLK
jgi:molybdopterin/thiamine biosynthesis adenylyltransferase